MHKALILFAFLLLMPDAAFGGESYQKVVGDERMVLHDTPCALPQVIELYGGDGMAPKLASGDLYLRAGHQVGCWYDADGHVFFTSTDGVPFVPAPAIEDFEKVDTR